MARTWFSDQAQKLNIRVHLTERRALENYFPEAAVQRVCGIGVKALRPYEPHDGARWRKHDNWRIAREIRSEEFEKNDVMRFLREVVGQVDLG